MLLLSLGAQPRLRHSVLDAPLLLMRPGGGPSPRTNFAQVCSHLVSTMNQHSRRGLMFALGVVATGVGRGTLFKPNKRALRQNATTGFPSDVRAMPSYPTAVYCVARPTYLCFSFSGSAQPRTRAGFCEGRGASFQGHSTARKVLNSSVELAKARFVLPALNPQREFESPFHAVTQKGVCT